ncbi:MAG: recombination protein RecR [Candidatus Moranbacteria bacterium CG10_big_fil_rev_8_21_14_0_10_35_21]|nr:MAG: recombination protein RecR [Candidatus Moranbacteria bacterium CG10_big_fil_rev_8_21_14_0_10_35_21]PJA88524.1 MAG: recombination protein RecR [Candidatus Moranbacteria bacterium CG_4_9_14_3_um_filter_36_9]
MYPKSFRKLIDNFASLPSVGPKMAERLVLHLFKQPVNKIKDFALNLAEIKNLKICGKCFNIAEENLCEICKNTKRNQKIICVVEEPLDIISLEKIGSYAGLYHVLGGLIFSEAGEKNELKIPELIHRIKKEKIEEVILATNPTTEGDATSLYLKKQLQPLNVKITRLARGLATGGDIEYADETTLSASLTNRREML